jgi:hypothetical protein
MAFSEIDGGSSDFVCRPDERAHALVISQEAIVFKNI